MVAEITVAVKNDEKSLKTNHLVYDEFQASQDDPLIQRLIQETSQHFLKDAEEITDIKVTIKLEIT